jgi:hypothetical protein
MEIRYLVRPGWDGPEKVLQYRTLEEVTDYTSVNPNTSDYWKKSVWSEWKDVPTVEDK